MAFHAIASAVSAFAYIQSLPCAIGVIPPTLETLPTVLKLALLWAAINLLMILALSLTRRK